MEKIRNTVLHFIFLVNTQEREQLFVIYCRRNFSTLTLKCSKAWIF